MTYGFDMIHGPGLIEKPSCLGEGRPMPLCAAGIVPGAPQCGHEMALDLVHGIDKFCKSSCVRQGTQGQFPDSSWPGSGRKCRIQLGKVRGQSGTSL